ncbi:serine/threonine protein kinase, CMGC, partial [Coemansia nantahalensis]
PHSGSRYSKDEDHLAQIIETIGPMPKKFALSGRQSSAFFNRRVELRNIRRLRPLPLRDLLRDDYGFSAQDARETAEFLLPMLEINPAHRSSAESMLFKTALCKSYAAHATCRYGRDCRFAHGLGELRQRPNPPKFKTVPCRNEAQGRTCPYGAKCDYIHRDDSVRGQRDTPSTGLII